MRLPPLELLFQWLFKGGANRERERNRKRQRQRERIDETAGCRHFFLYNPFGKEDMERTKVEKIF